MSGAPGGKPRGYSVLIVCTGNVCRSPMAEAYLRAAMSPADGVLVGSAGLYARAGEPIDPGMARLIDVPFEGVARPVTPDLVRDADLVLTMTRDQRSAIVSTVPAAVRSTFTLREFAELADLACEHGVVTTDGPAGERLRSLVATAPRFRGMRRAGDHDDIADPFGGRAADYDRVAAEIKFSVAQLVWALEGLGILRLAAARAATG